MLQDTLKQSVKASTPACLVLKLLLTGRQPQLLGLVGSSMVFIVLDILSSTCLNYFTTTTITRPAAVVTTVSHLMESEVYTVRLKLAAAKI